LTDLVTLHIETNDIVAQYEQEQPNNYNIDSSFYWLPDNILAVNFINTSDLYKDLCRLHRITHTFRVNPFMEAVVSPDLEKSDGD
jgi:hypothetical protein